jgi:hypothetical protein
MNILTEEGGSGWKKLHNEEFPNYFPSPNIIMVAKLRRVR